MNLVLKSENKEHESVIATSKIDTCILEIKSESNCEKCLRNEPNQILVYDTESNKEVSIIFLREPSNFRTALTKAKTFLISKSREVFVKAKVDGEFLKETRPFYFISTAAESLIDITCTKFQNVNRNLKIFVENASLTQL